MKPLERGNQRGAILMITILFCLMLGSLMIYLLNMAYQRTRLVDAVGIKRTRNYYRAQAGIVDAFWRIRNNRTLPGWPSNFSDPNFSVEYYMDIDSGVVTAAKTASSTIKVSVGTKNQTVGNTAYGLRPIFAVGLDT